jgi:hypothetical protein
LLQEVIGMSITAEPSLDQALALARRLTPRDQARLITQLVAALADAPTETPPTAEDAWSGWTALRDDIALHFPQARPAERLAADRREREAHLSSTEH